MKKILLLALFGVLLASCSQEEKENYYIEGVSEPLIVLNGIWKITTNPTEEFWKDTTISDEWTDIQVPGECMMQGVSIKHDEPFVYKREVFIPDDYSDKNIKLQFDGVYSYARVWVNGKKVMEHHGGFTSWQCDITSFVQAGKYACITVEVTDRADEISYASGYAKHQIGGILRDIYLLALPCNYPEHVYITTDLDDEYEDAVLLISGKLKSSVTSGRIELELCNADNNSFELKNPFIELNGQNTFSFKNEIKNPAKWDAEHPILYNLKISFIDNDKPVWQKIYKIGFREIELAGNKLLVNGKQVKLRGACRHDIHPLLGRVSTPEYELKDVMLAKEANINFIRTSHYPPTDNFLALCDEHGLYVEDETAVCFVGSHRTEEYYPGASEKDPAFTERYLSQLQEMVDNHRNHPSVLFWSIGNENSYGINFKKSYDWVRAADPTRLVIFSYPGQVPDSVKAYDLLSMHYPGISGDMNQHGIETEEFGFGMMPVIFDEWAHVACYCNFTVKEDPNIRNFWGQSLDKMWQRVFEADGGLGGAIWGMIDETFMLPDTLPGFNKWWGKIDKNVIPAEYTGHTVGYGEWGIVDTWRRKKPEFWNTKKAYSPFKLLNTVVEDYHQGDPLMIPVHNRFDHTNFNELDIRWTCKNETGTLDAVDLEPHAFGKLTIPVDNWDRADPLIIECFDSKDRLIDKYALWQNQKDMSETPVEKTAEISVDENDDNLIVSLANGSGVTFEKSTGLITSIRKGKSTVKCSGPFLNFRTRGEAIMYSSHKIDEIGSDWSLSELTYRSEKHRVTVSVKGDYADLKHVEYQMIIMSDGKMDIHYNISSVPDQFVREAGLKFFFEKGFDAVAWQRDTYWSFYPENHLSSKEGSIPLYSKKINQYRVKPGKDWREDTKSFYYNGTANEEVDSKLTYASRSTKENIREFSLLRDGSKLISITGNGDISCRVSKMGNRLVLHVNNIWDYIDLSWGNYQKNIKIENDFKGVVNLNLNY